MENVNIDLNLNEDESDDCYFLWIKFCLMWEFN